MRRQWAAAEAKPLGWGGVSTVALLRAGKEHHRGGNAELEHRRTHPEVSWAFAFAVRAAAASR